MKTAGYLLASFCLGVFLAVVAYIVWDVYLGVQGQHLLFALTGSFGIYVVGMLALLGGIYLLLNWWEYRSELQG